MAIVVESGVQLTEAVVGDDGSLRLIQESGIGLKAGDKVLLAILPCAKPNANDYATLKGTVLRYDSPFESAAEAEDWEALREC